MPHSLRHAIRRPAAVPFVALVDATADSVHDDDLGPMPRAWRKGLRIGGGSCRSSWRRRGGFRRIGHPAFGHGVSPCVFPSFIGAGPYSRSCKCPLIARARARARAAGGYSASRHVLAGSRLAAAAAVSKVVGRKKTKASLRIAEKPLPRLSNGEKFSPAAKTGGRQSAVTGSLLQSFRAMDRQAQDNP